MQIEISDTFYKKLQDLEETYFHSNISEYLENLFERELYKNCAVGYEIDALTRAKTRFQLEKDIYNSLYGFGWADNSILRNKYLCLDIANFKSYVSMCGIQESDKILVKIIQEFKEKYPNKSIYRIGGDEFVVELSEIEFVPLDIGQPITLKYSIVNVEVQKNFQRSFICNSIIYYLEKGVIEATAEVNVIEFKYKE